MSETFLIGIATILFAGTLAQWFAWRVRLPSIMMLLVFGFLLGPFTGFLNVDEIFGNILVPIINFSVAIILFEGGLTLKLKDLRGTSHVIINLLTIGMIISFTLMSLASHYILGLEWPLSFILSAILVVTGPTVIGPLLRHIRPKGSVGSILKWEGIIIDPIGVMLAILVFELVIIADPFRAPQVTLQAITMTLLTGIGFGYLAGLFLSMLVKNRWLPEFLQSAFVFATVVLLFVLSNHIQEESGLLTVTVMGMVMANRPNMVIDHIVAFKENLQVLLISSVFIILASRLNINDFYNFGYPELLFVGSLIFIIRPVAVFFSSFGYSLKWKEKFLMMMMAPRGIVAAAMASLLSIELAHFEVPGAERLVPLVFLVIVSTVVFYGLLAKPLATALGLSQASAQGALILGGHKWALYIAKTLQDAGAKVTVVDTNADHISEAKTLGLECIHDNVLTDHFLEKHSLDGVGKLVAVTSNEEVNSMAALRFMTVFGRTKVFQLSTEEKYSKGRAEFPMHMRGSILFNSGMTFDFFEEHFSRGAFLITKVLDKESLHDITEGNTPLEIPLFAVNEEQIIKVFAKDDFPDLEEGDHLICLDLNSTHQSTNS
jgi:NhaP-type Na+/H+ or K+/H+ antiporter